MALLASANQILVQDPRGKTHALLFYPQDSIAENLERHSLQLRLPPPAELYILWGSRIIQADLTGADSGLSQEPLLRILLRGRGGMRGGIRGSTQSASGSRGRGYGSPGGRD